MPATLREVLGLAQAQDYQDQPYLKIEISWTDPDNLPQIIFAEKLNFWRIASSARAGGYHKWMSINHEQLRFQRGVRLFLTALLTLFFLSGAATASAAEQFRYQAGPSAPLRMQWNSNFGYCGEASMVAAGLRFGQYASQWSVRRLASPGVSQSRWRSQLLIGENSTRAGQSMRLQIRNFNNSRERRTEEMLNWTKSELLSGSVPIIGVFNNVYALGEQPSLADPVYDHIVPVSGWSSSRPLSGPNRNRALADDKIWISDNGLFGIDRLHPYLFGYRINGFLRTRQGANQLGGPLYSLRRTPPNYAMSVAGIIDPGQVTAPVSLWPSRRDEGRENKRFLYRPPAAKKLWLTAVVRPERSIDYRLYMYSSFASVPVRDFNRQRNRAERSWLIPAGSKRWQVRVRTNTRATRVFRAVPVDAR